MNKLKVKKTNWDLSSLFKNDNDKRMEKERKEILKKNNFFIKKWEGNKEYLRNPKILKRALDEYSEIQKKYSTSGKQGFYFSLRFHQEENNPKIKAKLNKIEEFEKKILNDILFFELNISKIPKKIQNKFLKDKELKEYIHFLEKLFIEGKYLLSDKEEKILNLKSSVSYSNWVNMLSGFLSKEQKDVLNEKGKKEKKSFSEILSLMSNRNKRVRDSAAKAFNEILENNSDAAEAELNSVFSNKKINDELRKMKRPDLSRHISDDIDSEIVDTLIKEVSKRDDIPKRYYKLKSKLLKLKKLEYHERNVSYGKIDKKYSYSKAINLIKNVFDNLDIEFKNIFVDFINNGKIDVYPKKGKTSGAFCSHNLISQPVFVLLNWNNQFRDITTLAHEMGHAINYEFIRKKQNSLNYSIPFSIAEVSSTFFEDFVLKELGKKSDDELKLSLNMEKLNDDISTIFRQIACYQFELETHKQLREKGYLSKKEIGEIFRKYMSSYMGSYVKQSSGSENWWVYWSHIRNFFYNYSYASGLLISKFLQRKTIKDRNFIEKVKDFLSYGSSDSPKNIFKKLGINISDRKIWQEGIKEIENLLTETEKLAKKLKKM
jgi:oligoendopeptidase F